MGDWLLLDDCSDRELTPELLPTARSLSLVKAKMKSLGLDRVNWFDWGRLAEVCGSVTDECGSQDVLTVTGSRGMYKKPD